jgi:hypothetical protein
MMEAAKREASNGDDLLVYTVPQAGAKIGLSRNASYDAAKRGELGTVVKVGRLLLVPKLSFHRKFGGEP